MNYRDVNDYEVLYLIEDENDNYKSIIYKKYSFLVKDLCKKYQKKFFNIPVDSEDLYQEALLGIDNAIRYFNVHKNVSFFTYCYICVERKIKDYYTLCNGKNNLFFANSVSLDKDLLDNHTLYDLIPSFGDVCNMLIYFENIEEIIKFKNSLSFDQSCVFELRMNGFSCGEIARLLDLGINKVYLYIRKIKEKYKSVYSS